MSRAPLLRYRLTGCLLLGACSSGTEPGPDRFAEVSFGMSGTACGVALDGAASCWGSGFRASLGSPESPGDGEGSTLPLKLYGSP